MRRRSVTALVLLIVFTLFACLFSQMFDHWDHSETKGKDTESTLIVVAEAAGMGIAVLHAGAAFLPRLVAGKPVVVRRVDVFPFVSFKIRLNRLPESPPPLALRI